MRDYGVTYKSVPHMCDSSSAICLTHNPVSHGRAKHIKVRHHFLRDHVEKGEVEMKLLTQRGSWLTFSPNPLILLLLLLFLGSLVFAIPMAWFEGEHVICLVYLYHIAFLLHFLHTHLSHLASPIILACICSIILIIVLG
jgi:hypothetical protein